MYNIIALIGESGSGKDTVMQYLLKSYPLQFNEIISCTTRPPREGEVDGVNYHFITNEQFACKVLNYEMLEATNFNDWFYGTSYDSLRSDIYNIGVFNPDGIRALMDNPNVNVTVFKIVCSKKTRLMRQLCRESDPNVDEIVRRYQADQKDFENLEFPYIEVYNEDEMPLNIVAEHILRQTHLWAAQDKNY